jgi:hypothetical protein
MPNQRLALLVRLIDQNKGRLSTLSDNYLQS